jgi:hypothetical protein
VGEACAAYQDRVMNNLPCTQIECDEIWSFVGAKQKNVRKDEDTHADYGDCYTFTAMDPEHEADALLARWPAFCGMRRDIHARPGAPPRQAHATHHRWVPRLQAYAVDLAFVAIALTTPS